MAEIGRVIPLFTPEQEYDIKARRAAEDLAAIDEVAELGETAGVAINALIARTAHENRDVREVANAVLHMVQNLVQSVETDSPD